MFGVDGESLVREGSHAEMDGLERESVSLGDERNEREREKEKKMGQQD